MIGDIISVLDTGIRAFLDISRKPDAYADAFANEDFERVGLALDVLYFESNGVLAVLKDMATGEQLTSGHADLIWTFNDAEPEVKQALSALSRAAGDQMQMSKEDRVNLSVIADLKAGVRWDIKQIANQAVSMGVQYDRAEISALVMKIEELNAAILAADKRLRKMRKI